MSTETSTVKQDQMNISARKKLQFCPYKVQIRLAVSDMAAQMANWLMQRQSSHSPNFISFLSYFYGHVILWELSIFLFIGNGNYANLISCGAALVMTYLIITISYLMVHAFSKSQ